MNKRILVTGGRGYLGSRLVSYLENLGYIIYLGSRKNNTLQNWGNSVSEINIDWNNLNNIDDILKNTDCIIHLAGANEIESSADPVTAMSDTAMNTYKLLQASVKNNVKRFIYLSTIHIYGSPLKGIISEETLPRPVHPYAITHRAAEDFVISFSDKNLIEGIIVRLSNGFGYPELKTIDRWKLVINDFCKNAVEIQNIIINSSGEQKRDFITITDFCRGVDHLINLKNVIENIFNLGGNTSVTIKQMAEKVSLFGEELLNMKIPVITGTAESNINEFKYSIEKICNTGFELKNPVDLEIKETLKRCIGWYGK